MTIMINYLKSLVNKYIYKKKLYFVEIAILKLLKLVEN